MNLGIENGPLLDLTGAQLMDSAIHGVSVSMVDPATGSGHIVYASENLLALLGYEAGELLGQNPGVLLWDETPAGQLDEVAELVAGGMQATVSLRLAHRDGETIPVRASFLQLPVAVDGWPYYLSVFRDETQTDVAGELLEDSADLLDGLVDGQDFADLLDQIAERLERRVSGGASWVALTDRAGGLEPTVVGKHDRDLVAATLRELTESDRINTKSFIRVGDLSPMLEAGLREVGVEALWITPLRGRTGGRRGVLVVAHSVRLRPTDDERLVLAHFSRLATLAIETTVAEAQLAHEILHDPLTSLPNRTLIADRLEQALARLGRGSDRLAVLLVDIDRFRFINQSESTEIGDEVLVEVSYRLRQSVRLGDTVGRITGDQFMVLGVAVAGDVDVRAMAERILEGIGQPFIVAGGTKQISITASVGVVLVEESGHSPNVIISQAELALAEAIAAGRSRYAVFEEGRENPKVIRHQLEKALEIAVDEDELEVYYQPLVDIATGRMIGAEALLRWNRPGMGVLPPSEFIEIAEDSGLIVPMGAWTIDEVCRQLAAWPKSIDGAKPVISVNLSAQQLSHASLLTTIANALDRHGVRAEQLGFEVTESMKVKDVDRSTATLQQLSSRGCKLSIDDFGIGYATLDYLRRFSMADTIKIDRSFVSGIGTSKQDTVIIGASMRMANDLGLAVVAEGVETLDQFMALSEMGCQVAQGYLLSQPVPLEQARKLWAQRQLITPLR